MSDWLVYIGPFGWIQDRQKYEEMVLLIPGKLAFE